LPYALGVRAELAWWTGEWTSARSFATEALRRAEQLQQVPTIGFALVTLARVEMSRGDLAEGQRLSERALRETGPYSVDGSRPYIDAVLGLGRLAAGEAETATEHLDRARRGAERCGLAASCAVPFGGDLVEAHIRAGHEAQAREALSWLEEQAAATGLVFPAAAAARCRGLLTPDLDRAAELFALARSLYSHRDLPFERGRALLCEGETLRRLRRPATARPVLREALALFTKIGSRPWAARAKLELATIGTGSGACPHPGLSALTPRELQIARGVADGGSNAEVASALFISRRAAEAHLSRIYCKLGIRSRTELARRVAELARESDGRADR
jgi:ATP/maltotriose-dependent transcriptional regulator MalT